MCNNAMHNIPSFSLSLSFSLFDFVGTVDATAAMRPYSLASFFLLNRSFKALVYISTWASFNACLGKEKSKEKE